MKLLLSDSGKIDQLVNIFENLKVFSATQSINFHSDHIYIQGLDSSHVLMYELRLDASYFNEYESGNAVLGVNNGILYKILKTREPSHQLIITHDEKKDQLELVLETPDNSNYKKEFVIPLIDLTVELFDIPDMDYEAEIVFVSKMLNQYIHQLATFGDTLDIACDETAVSFCAKDVDGEMRVNIPTDELQGYCIDEGRSMNTLYSMKYMNTMCLFWKLCKDVSVSISENYPMKVQYNISEIEDQACYLRFYLAPKMDVNDD